MNKFEKVTTGFVSQSFEKGDDGNFHCKSLSFCAGDVEYEDNFGDALPPEKLQEATEKEISHPFEMVQPNTEIVILVEGGLIQNVLFPSGLNDVAVVVKDYDTDGSTDVEKDENGDEHVESRWTNLD